MIGSERKLRKWLQENIEKTHDVEHTEKVVPLITGEIALRQHVCELVFGVNKCDLDVVVRIDSVKQPIKRNSVCSGHVSHCWTSSFDNHLDDCFVVFKNVKLRLTLRKMCQLSCTGFPDAIMVGFDSVVC